MTPESEESCSFNDCKNSQLFSLQILLLLFSPGIQGSISILLSMSRSLSFKLFCAVREISSVLSSRLLILSFRDV